MRRLMNVALAHFVAEPWLHPMHTRPLYARARWVVVHDRTMREMEPS